MANFSDFPGEIHEKIAEKLSAKDLKTLRLTCHTVNNAVTRVFMYHLNYLPCDHIPPRSILFSTSLDEASKVKNGRILSRSLAEYSETQPGKIIRPTPNAAYVFKLCMGKVSLQKCPHNASCGLNIRLFQKFTNLKDLTIDVYGFKRDLIRLRLPETLEALRLFTEDRVGHQGMPLQKSVCTLRHPNLRVLHLTNFSFTTDPVHLGLEALDSDLAAVTDQTPRWLPRLESLALVNLRAKAFVLNGLLRRWKNARRLWITLDPIMANLGYRGHEAATIQSLNDDLQQFKHSITELYLTVTPGVYGLVNPVLSGHPVLKIQDFTCLQRLSIDPALVTGLRLCRYGAPDPEAPSIEYTSHSDLATLLPDSLEYLCLQFNREQTYQATNYKSDTVGGIVEAWGRHNRLLSLKEIIVLTDPSFDAIRISRPRDGSYSETWNQTCYPVDDRIHSQDERRLRALQLYICHLLNPFPRSHAPIIYRCYGFAWFDGVRKLAYPCPEGF